MNVDRLDDTATDEQLRELQTLVDDVLCDEVVRSVVDQAEDVAYDLIDEMGCDGPDEVNAYLRDEVHDMFMDSLDPMQAHGIVPYTDGHAHDALNEVVAKKVDRVMEDVRVYDEDIYIQLRNIRTDPDRLYEKEKEKRI